MHGHSSEPTGHGGGRSGPGVEVDEVVGAVPVVGPASVDVVDGAPVDVVGDPSVVVWEAGGQAQRRAATMMGLRMRRGYLRGPGVASPRMATIVLPSATPSVLTVEGTINSAGEVVADLTPSSIASGAGALLAAENLDDVADPDVSRANIGAVDVALSEAAGVSTALGDYADDAAAAIGGVAVGALYRTGSILKTRVA